MAVVSQMNSRGHTLVQNSSPGILAYFVPRLKNSTFSVVTSVVIIEKDIVILFKALTVTFGPIREYDCGN